MVLEVKLTGKLLIDVLYFHMEAPAVWVHIPWKLAKYFGVWFERMCS